MRVKLAFLVVLALLVGAQPSHAEKAKARADAKVYNRAGEQGKVVVKVKEGQSLTVLDKDGRWLKVRVSGRTGYIPRSKVELPEGDDEIVRNTRRRPFVDGRGTKRGFGGEAGPDDRVGADAVDVEKPEPRGKDKVKDKDKDKDSDDDADSDDDTSSKDTDDDEPKDAKDDDEAEARATARVKSKTTVYAEASGDSDEAFTASPKMTLFPTGNKKGKYVEVENEEGDIGFVLASKLEMEEVEGGEGGAPKTRVIDGRARLGVTIIQQGLRTAGGVPEQPDNYNLSTSAITLALGGTYLRPYSKQYMLGADLNFDLAKAVPGIEVGDGTKTSITLYNLNVRGLVGYDMKKKSGMMVFGRLGLRWQSYQVADALDLTKNKAKLPSEILTSPTLGAALTIPKMTPKIGLRFSLDAMLFAASVKQTKNLEDGQDPSAKGACLGAGFTYRWKPAMDIQATYDLNYMKYSFGAPVDTSMRGHMGTDVKRTDIFHAVTVGIAKAF
ncbi:MAG TPA: SH3 domain-containing protein [Kofleriaceae bacterium]|nr:SH3 domain-containing protein [Kofleriaceae bacterium]